MRLNEVEKTSRQIDTNILFFEVEGWEMSDTGWHLKLLGPAGNDVTERFNALVAQAKAGNSAAVPADAKKYAYLLIPGLFTENYP